MAAYVNFVHRRLDQYVALAAKCRRAAAHPWLFVPPDPPLPEIPAEIAVR
jgi:hypothetical protein